MFIIPYIVIIIVAISLALFFNQSFAKVLPASLFFIAIIIYFAGFTQNLKSIILYYLP
ncbi:MAG: hypothetical protein Q4F88_02150 [Eubacteriales bacterium]|nr:hypothetical protein [Eubacteriales bacterium]